MNEIRIPVLIVGGGTVGLYLAMELGFHGVECLLVTEQSTTSTHPKGSTINARSMEHLRRLGVARAIRRLGIPADHTTQVGHGYAYGTVELWDPDRRLVAFASQRGHIRAVDPARFAAPDGTA